MQKLGHKNPSFLIYLNRGIYLYINSTNQLSQINKDIIIFIELKIRV